MVRINNDPYAFRSVLEDAGEHPAVVLEATYGWYWAADLLAELGAEVHLAHPLGVKGFAYRREKNDFLDAADQQVDRVHAGPEPDAMKERGLRSSVHLGDARVVHCPVSTKEAPCERRLRGSAGGGD